MQQPFDGRLRSCGQIVLEPIPRRGKSRPAVQMNDAGKIPRSRIARLVGSPNGNGAGLDREIGHRIGFASGARLLTVSDWSGS
jgi:hypothetical protein